MVAIYAAGSVGLSSNDEAADVVGECARDGTWMVLWPLVVETLAELWWAMGTGRGWMVPSSLLMISLEVPFSSAILKSVVLLVLLPLSVTILDGADF